MSISVHAAESDEAELNTTINTTPLVDVMLVLLIIFLITVPVVLKQIPVQYPNARNIPTITKPENIVIAVDKDEALAALESKATPDGSRRSGAATIK